MAYDFSKVKTLVVDDSAAMRRLIIALLNAIGFERIDQAKDGLDGWESFKNKSHQLVICDWYMGGRDGLQLVSKIRLDKASPNRFAHIMMLTGYSERFRVQMAIDAGVHDFLCKPVTPENFYKRIYRLVDDTRDFIAIGPYFGPESSAVTPLAQTGFAEQPSGA
jgi:CheY-like chemotaxis protein